MYELGIGDSKIERADKGGQGREKAEGKGWEESVRMRPTTRSADGTAELCRRFFLLA